MDATLSAPAGLRRMRVLVRPAALFITIGIALYVGLYIFAERLVYDTGKSNAFFKIETAGQTDFDWVILGASHAMPLDFDDTELRIEQETGLSLINLAAPGAGPLYNRLALEHFFTRHDTRHVLYIIDSFAFHAREWNEDRIADRKLISRTPFSFSLAARLAGYAAKDEVDVRVLLDYVSGFSKLNNRDRFKKDVWEGEAQFDRTARASPAADRNRIAYLYPADANPALTEHYLQELAQVLRLAARHGASTVLIKMPVPGSFYRSLPGEAEFDAALSRLAEAEGVRLADFSSAMDARRFYFDTDHLNRAGVFEFLSVHLQPLLNSVNLEAREAPSPDDED